MSEIGAKLNPLHTPEMIYEYVKASGRYFPEHRYTGRSTAQALMVLARALETPGKKFYFVDHFGTPAANTMQARLGAEMVKKLGLIGFKFTNDSVIFGQ